MFLKPDSDFSIMARVRLSWGDGRVHPLFGAGIGGGEIRHLVDLSSVNASRPLVDDATAIRSAHYPPGQLPPDQVSRVCPGATCIDTVTMEQLLFSLSAGTYFDLVVSPRAQLRLVLEAETIVAAHPSVGLNYDFHAGFEAAFF